MLNYILSFLFNVHHEHWSVILASRQTELHVLQCTAIPKNKQPEKTPLLFTYIHLYPIEEMVSNAQRASMHAQ